ncbi:hypothetical protein JRO89_XSUnG0102100 [Xanthoceras sorbifolium]|uniref:Uncharacterized protein n=1 Tax=Xanthoceras sorbifolium TaxID=99658 RepID=A0ABQ8GZG2_9ROSI|nr:hypothetical protein JRO89_XSUnG0102100 [Xanthoceras sorbifolium]
MNGTISESIGQLTELIELDLYGNSWKGVISENLLHNLTQLTDFYLSSTSNSLVFNARHDWIPSFSLETFAIRDCQLGPAFPSWLRTQVGVTDYIILSNVNILDAIPDLFWRSISPRYGLLLDLSHNQLRGELPKSINVGFNASIDFGFNRLEGGIPGSICSLPSLVLLKLSHNNLSAELSFQTFNDPSIYEGNPYLCGPPLTTNCSLGLVDTEDKAEEVEDEDGSEKFWLYVGMALGFILGFWAVCGTLIIKRSWRQAYFRLVDETKDKLLVFIAVYMARLRRKVARQMSKGTNVGQQ